VAAIPSFFGLLLFFFIREAGKKVTVFKSDLSLSIKGLSTEFKLFSLGMGLFYLGNSSDTFLILRAKNFGLSLIAVLSAYVLYNLVYALASTPFGKISDKIGHKKVVVAGIFIFSLVHLGFALNQTRVLVWPLFMIYGFYTALTDGVARAWVGEFINKNEAGTAYGVMNTIISVMTLLASVIGGLLWTFISPTATFLFAAGCALISLIVFIPIKVNRA
jgi:MFS family permease